MPHFSKEALERSLREEGIDYLHLKELGGRRKPQAGSPNLGWRSEGFRGYADHMGTEKFDQALELLTAVARERRSALMCAEALWWRCHRRLISDALLLRGWRVCHIGSGGKVEDHELTPFATVTGGRITYPATQTSLEL
jgi:uncharacterized protein (DUF488 family)